MGIEVATYISDLVPANPGSGDLRSQGDDHIRLEKQVLQNTFPNASKAFYFPSTQARALDFTVAAADMNKVFFVSTAGGVVIMTLPTLASGDAGWRCQLYKYTLDANPVIISAPTGLIFSGEVQSLTKTRRCVPGKYIDVVWTGSNWFIGRAVDVPIGSVLEYHRGSLPPGYEWPNGQVLASASTLYPDYNAVTGSGTTLDKRGRVGIPLDNLGGSAAGRLAGGVITGTTVGNVGGVDTVTLSLAQIPTGINSSGPALAITGSSSASVGQGGTLNTVGTPGAGTPVNFVSGPGLTLSALAVNGTSAAQAVTSNNTSGALHSNLQPSMMVSQILVVE